jgi:RNA polymerase sigma-70 factor (sigma-E family)
MGAAVTVGDNTALRVTDFREFVALRSPALLRSAWLLTGDWGAAEDLVQTALAATWSRRARIESSFAWEAYTRKVMMSTFLSWHRKRSSREAPAYELPDQAAGAGPPIELRVELLRAMAALPARQRAVITLRYFEDLTEADTARALGCSIGAVKSHASRALRSLRARPALAGLIDGISEDSR